MINHYQSPPKVPLTLRVGVVGHRPDRLQDADTKKLSSVLKKILTAAKTAAVSVSLSHRELIHLNGSPVLRAISPLAEGVDRIFATQALDLGFELCCIMPFEKQEYEKDFSPDNAFSPNSLHEFLGLLDRAKKETDLTRFELNGEREPGANPYGVAGRFVLKQSDVLVVVWDGLFLGKIGGTEEIMKQANALGIPMVWVDARDPHTCQIIKPGSQFARTKQKGGIRSDLRYTPDGSFNSDKLQKCFEDILTFPASEKEGTKIKKNFKAFLKERRPKFSIAVVWKIFRDIVGDMKRPKIFPLSIPPFESDILTDWPEKNTTPHERITERLRPYYAWPNKLAVIYSDLYRSTYILTFFLATLAVGFALAPIGLPIESIEPFIIFLEFLAIVFIIILVPCGRWRRWHERWLDYRIAAELVRHLRLVSALGGGRAFVQPQAHLVTYGDPGSTWMAWYVKSLERYIGMPDVVVNRKHMKKTVDNLLEIVTRQTLWHRSNAQRCHRMEHRLHITGLLAFIMTAIACFFHLLPGLGIRFPDGLSYLAHFFHHERSVGMLTALGGILPALGATIAGIINQGEFTRIEKRSKSMADKLAQLKTQIEELQTALGKDSEEYSAQYFFYSESLATQAADLMLYEVMDWRVVFMDRPLITPG